MSGDGGADRSVPTRWLEVSVVLPSADASHQVARRLLELGGRAVVEDSGRLLTHLAEPDDPARVASRLRTTLAGDLGVPDVEVRLDWQAHRDWSELWKRGLAPRRVTPRLVVTPSWCHPEAGPEDLMIVLDPGMAFGTAEHGTTRGCLRLLDAAVRPGQRVLDVGAGSGILSIAAARLGATRVLALEADAWAVEPARENVVANGVAGTVEVRAGWVDPEDLAALGPHDGVVANIETGMLTRLMPGFRAAVRSGGWLILSGIQHPEWEGFVRDAARAGFRLETPDTDGAWRSGLFRRTGGSS